MFLWYIAWNMQLYNDYKSVILGNPLQLVCIYMSLHKL